jgi:type IV pilus assembly protein PilC
MLDYLAEAGEERSDDLLERVTSLIAPLMLLAVGLMIAFMVIAMYLPMFGSYNTLGL